MRCLRRVFIAFAFIPSLAIAQPTPLSGPGPVQVSGISMSGETLAWSANTEEDLGGYLVHYSVNGTAFVFVNTQYIDVGNVTTFSIKDSTVLAPYMIAGNTLFFGVSAYDVAGESPDYDEGGDNRSGIQSQTDSGGEVASNFTLDVPPATPSGVSIN